MNENYHKQRRTNTADLFGATSDDVRKRVLEKSSAEIAETIQDFLVASEQGKKFSNDNLEVIVTCFEFSHSKQDGI